MGQNQQLKTTGKTNSTKSENILAKKKKVTRGSRWTRVGLFYKDMKLLLYVLLLYFNRTNVKETLKEKKNHETKKQLRS